ncbi:MAG: MBOAT family protein [Candidatus Shapirobacteria bacterium]|nr:MBOAT family protein [Candidatus Shapirobacteria bacterium]
MLFTSPLFLFGFLPTVLIIYYISPSKIRNILLILFSLFFYAWGEGIYVLILLIMILANYFFGLKISRSRYRRIFTFIAVIFNLSYIFYFKYLLFTLHVFHIKNSLSILMPLGVSFVTFHLISYILDIYKKEIKAEKNFLNFALYILMFPHLIAGPIVRYKDISAQIKNRTFSTNLFAEGVRRFISGLAKKVLIANVLALVADQIFNLFPQQLSTPLVWIALLSYALQILFDFSGYSDMAIGLAKMFGFTFKENFNFPYVANSIQDFWRRWHISLSSWFRDYLYIPLGGNRRGLFLTLINITIVFTLTGFWHGADWHFLFWGFYFAFFLVLERLFLLRLLQKIWFGFGHLYALTVVFFGWLFFRIDSLNYALYLLKVMFGYNSNQSVIYQPQYFVTKEYLFILITAIFFSIPLYQKIYQKIIQKIPSFEIIFFTTIFIFSLMRLAGDTYNPFIYFRF